MNEICPEFFYNLVNLQELNLSNNQLEDLPRSITKLNNLTKLVIFNNKFRCDCDTLWMTKWILGHGSAVEKSKGIMCFSGRGQGKHLIDLHQDDVACNDPLIHGLIGLAITFILTIILATVIYKYKGYIKVWLYARFGFHPWDKVKENPQDKDYDAFVFFCHKDADWVLKTLLPYLEAPQCGFHLCVHDRDFVPGATITKNITTAIEFSRRTILVLSPDFIKSEWCDFEFQAAHKRAMDDRSNFLIVVVLKEVDDKDLDETLRLYMKTNTYVTVNDRWFWQKMLYSLPKVPIGKLKSQQNDDNMKDGDNRKNGNNKNGQKDQKCNVQNNRNGVNDRNGGNKKVKKNRNDGNRRNGANDRNDETDIELGVARCFDYGGAEVEDDPLLIGIMEDAMAQEDIPLLNDVIEEDHDYDDVPLLTDADDVVLLHCGCLSLIPFIEFMNLEIGTTHQVQMC